MDRVQKINERIDFLEAEVKSLMIKKETDVRVVTNVVEHTGLKYVGVGLFSLGICLLLIAEIYFKIPYGWWIATAVAAFFGSISILTEV